MSLKLRIHHALKTLSRSCRLQRIRQMSNDSAESLAGVLKQAWELLDDWLTQQKLELTCLAAPPDMAHLDALDNMYVIFLFSPNNPT